MSERDLSRAVAKATGESVESVQRLGFQLVGAHGPEEDLGPLVLDWDVRRPAYLSQVLSEDDWSGRVEPLPSYDEEYEDAEDYACVAA
jgi:hypothetical protein